MYIIEVVNIACRHSIKFIILKSVCVSLEHDGSSDNVLKDLQMPWLLKNG